MAAVTEWLTWRTAMERALYGPDGFYRRSGAGPAAHFRTSAHNPVFAEAIGRLLLQVDERLGTPERLDLVDMAAGRGELTAGVVQWLATRAPAVAGRLHATAVDPFVNVTVDPLHPCTLPSDGYPLNSIPLYVDFICHHVSHPCCGPSRFFGNTPLNPA